LLHRLHHPVGLDQFVEDILQDVLGVALVSHPLANKGAQAWVVAPHGLRDALILLRHRAASKRFVHL
jgi:hypothetical protein